jgi:hypothetical protein
LTGLFGWFLHPFRYSAGDYNLDKAGTRARY